MDSNPEQRHKTRFEHVAPITLKNIESGIIHKARMYNYSAKGLYFESDHKLSPGAEVFVGIANAPDTSDSSTYECYRATVKWRKELEESAYYYGYGAHFLGKVSAQEDGLPDGDKRKYPRKMCTVPCKYASQNALQEGVIENISIGGIFIKTGNPIAAGQTLELAIPASDRKEIVKRTGQVVWSDVEGFGVRFFDEKQTS